MGPDALSVHVRLVSNGEEGVTALLRKSPDRAIKNKFRNQSTTGAAKITYTIFGGFLRLFLGGSLELL